jgi:hypothetical protein
MDLNSKVGSQKKNKLYSDKSVHYHHSQKRREGLDKGGWVCKMKSVYEKNKNQDDFFAS